MNTAILLAAGKGTRLGGDLPKQFQNLGGEPLICRTARVFESSPVIDNIVLVTNANYLSFCEDLFSGFPKLTAIVPGGAERYDSVIAGLSACPETDFVYIHDGARPFVTEEILQNLANALLECPAAIAAVPSKDTVKLVDGDEIVTATPPRSSVRLVQTPQAFDAKLLRKAYAIVREKSLVGITDDAMVMEASGLSEVRVVPGDERNIKITTREDLLYANYLLQMP